MYLPIAAPLDATPHLITMQRTRSTNPYSSRSIAMHTMHEALAREHRLRREREARQHRLVSELAAERRWRYLERRAHSAHLRHAKRARQVAQAG